MQKSWLVVAATVLILGCGQKKGPNWDHVKETASSFVSLLALGKTNEAYLSAAQALRSEQTEAGLAATAKELGLTPDYDSLEWGAGSINTKDRNRAVLYGTARRKNGEKVALKIKLVYEGADWRILSVGPSLSAAETAHAFVLLLAKGKTHDAYLSAAQALRTEQTEAEFTAAAKKLGLTPEYVTIGHFADSGDFDLDRGGTLIGSAWAEKGREIRLIVKLVDDGDGMYVRSVDLSPAASAK